MGAFKDFVSNIFNGKYGYQLQGATKYGIAQVLDELPDPVVDTLLRGLNSDVMTMATFGTNTFADLFLPESQKDLEEVINAYENGYGRFSGGRAVWEQTIGNQGRLGNIALTALNPFDPLNMLATFATPFTGGASQAALQGARAGSMAAKGARGLGAASKALRAYDEVSLGARTLAGGIDGVQAITQASRFLANPLANQRGARAMLWGAQQFDSAGLKGLASTTRGAQKTLHYANETPILIAKGLYKGSRWTAGHTVGKTALGKGIAGKAGKFSGWAFDIDKHAKLNRAVSSLQMALLEQAGLGVKDSSLLQEAQKAHPNAPWNVAGPVAGSAMSKTASKNSMDFLGLLRDRAYANRQTMFRNAAGIAGAGAAITQAAGNKAGQRLIFKLREEELESIATGAADYLLHKDSLLRQSQALNDFGATVGVVIPHLQRHYMEAFNEYAAQHGLKMANEDNVRMLMPFLAQRTNDLMAKQGSDFIIPEMYWMMDSVPAAYRGAEKVMPLERTSDVFIKRDAAGQAIKNEAGHYIIDYGADKTGNPLTKLFQATELNAKDPRQKAAQDLLDHVSSRGAAFLHAYRQTGRSAVPFLPGRSLDMYEMGPNGSTTIRTRTYTFKSDAPEELRDETWHKWNNLLQTARDTNAIGNRVLREARINEAMKDFTPAERMEALLTMPDLQYEHLSYWRAGADGTKEALKSALRKDMEESIGSGFQFADDEWEMVWERSKYHMARTAMEAAATIQTDMARWSTAAYRSFYGEEVIDPSHKPSILFGHPSKGQAHREGLRQAIIEKTDRFGQGGGGTFKIVKNGKGIGLEDYAPDRGYSVAVAGTDMMPWGDPDTVLRAVDEVIDRYSPVLDSRRGGALKVGLFRDGNEFSVELSVVLDDLDEAETLARHLNQKGIWGFEEARLRDGDGYISTGGNGMAPRKYQNPDEVVRLLDKVYRTRRDVNGNLSAGDYWRAERGPRWQHDRNQRKLPLTDQQVVPNPKYVEGAKKGTQEAQQRITVEQAWRDRNTPTLRWEDPAEINEARKSGIYAQRKIVGDIYSEEAYAQYTMDMMNRMTNSGKGRYGKAGAFVDDSGRLQLDFINGKGSGDAYRKGVQKTGTRSAGNLDDLDNEDVATGAVIRALMEDRPLYHNYPNEMIGGDFVKMSRPGTSESEPILRGITQSEQFQVSPTFADEADPTGRTFKMNAAGKVDSKGRKAKSTFGQQRVEDLRDNFTGGLIPNLNSLVRTVGDAAEFNDAGKMLSWYMDAAQSVRRLVGEENFHLVPILAEFIAITSRRTAPDVNAWESARFLADYLSEGLDTALRNSDIMADAGDVEKLGRVLEALTRHGNAVSDYEMRFAASGIMGEKIKDGVRAMMRQHGVDDINVPAYMDSKSEFGKAVRQFLGDDKNPNFLKKELDPARQKLIKARKAKNPDLIKQAEAELDAVIEKGNQKMMSLAATHKVDADIKDIGWHRLIGSDDGVLKGADEFGNAKMQNFAGSVWADAAAAEIRREYADNPDLAEAIVTALYKADTYYTHDVHDARYFGLDDTVKNVDNAEMARGMGNLVTQRLRQDAAMDENHWLHRYESAENGIGRQLTPRDVQSAVWLYGARGPQGISMTQSPGTLDDTFDKIKMLSMADDPMVAEGLMRAVQATMKDSDEWALFQRQFRRLNEQIAELIKRRDAGEINGVEEFGYRLRYVTENFHTTLLRNMKTGQETTDLITYIDRVAGYPKGESHVWDPAFDGETIDGLRVAARSIPGLSTANAILNDVSNGYGRAERGVVQGTEFLDLNDEVMENLPQGWDPKLSAAANRALHENTFADGTTYAAKAKTVNEQMEADRAFLDNIGVKFDPEADITERIAYLEKAIEDAKKDVRLNRFILGANGVKPLDSKSALIKRMKEYDELGIDLQNSDPTHAVVAIMGKEIGKEMGIEAATPRGKYAVFMGAWKELALLSPRYHVGNIMSAWLHNTIAGHGANVEPSQYRKAVLAAIRKQDPAEGSRAVDIAIRYGKRQVGRDLTRSQASTELIAQGMSDTERIVSRITGKRAGRVVGKVMDFNRELASGIESSVRLSLWADLFETSMTNATPILQQRIDDYARKQGIDADELRKVFNLETMDGVLADADGAITAGTIAESLKRLGFDEGHATRAGRDWAEAVNKADRAALGEVNRLHFSYEKTNIDNVVAKFVPFHYWASRALRFYGEEMLSNPRLLQAFVKMQDGLERMSEDPELSGGQKGFLRLMAGPDGFTLFANPLSLIGAVQAMGMGGTHETDGETEIGALIRKGKSRGIGLFPWMEAALNYAGTLGDTYEPDPLGIRHRAIVGAVVNAAGAQMGAGPGPAPYAALNASIRGNISGWTSQYLPDALASSVPAAAAGSKQRATTESMIAQRIIAENPEMTNAELVEVMNDPDSIEYRSAWRDVARAGLIGQVLSFTVPVTARAQDNTRLERKSVGNLITAEADLRGMSPYDYDLTAGTAEFRVKYQQITGKEWVPGTYAKQQLQQDLALATPQAREFVLHQAEYRELGTDAQREAVRKWVELKNVNPTQASLFLQGAEGRQAKALFDIKAAYRQAHPDQAAYLDWYDKMVDLAAVTNGSLSGYRRKMSENNPAFRAWVERTAAYIRKSMPGATPQEMLAELDRRTISADVFLIATGVAPTLYSPNPGAGTAGGIPPSMTAPPAEGTYSGGGGGTGRPYVPYQYGVNMPDFSRLT